MLKSGGELFSEFWLIDNQIFPASIPAPRTYNRELATFIYHKQRPKSYQRSPVANAPIRFAPLAPVLDIKARIVDIVLSRSLLSLPNI